MNINKISTRNITTRITHLLKREEVVQAVYKNGEPVSFSTAPISAEQFKELIPGIQQIKIITKELAPNIFQRLTDTYTIVQNSGKVIKKLTLNYKNQSVTFITNMMDNSNKLRQKFVAKYEVYAIPVILANGIRRIGTHILYGNTIFDAEHTLPDNRQNR